MLSDTPNASRGYEMFGDDRMVVGISMSHPPPTGIKMTKEEEEDLKKAGGTIKPSPPAVVGVAVNSALRPTEFIGDVRYQDARRTDVEILFSWSKTNRVFLAVLQS